MCQKEKPRERTASQRCKEMEGGGNAERARCLSTTIVKTVRSSYILSCLSSGLLRASTEKVSYLFYRRGNEGTEVKHLPKVTHTAQQKQK